MQNLLFDRQDKTRPHPQTNPTPTKENQRCSTSALKRSRTPPPSFPMHGPNGSKPIPIYTLASAATNPNFFLRSAVPLQFDPSFLLFHFLFHFFLSSHRAGEARSKPGFSRLRAGTNRAGLARSPITGTHPPPLLKHLHCLGNTMGG